MHQVHNNENDYCWQFKGKKHTKTIGSNTGRRRLNIIGALNAITKETTIILTESNCDKYLLIVFLEEIKLQYNSTDKIYIILDNASYNRAYEVVEKAKELNIELVYLPPYAPNLNLIERLWKFFKKKVVKNCYYETYQMFYNAVNEFFFNFKSYQNEVNKIFSLNFGIIKAS